jgi:hypothetical protein
MLTIGRLGEAVNQRLGMSDVPGLLGNTINHTRSDSSCSIGDEGNSVS